MAYIAKLTQSLKYFSILKGMETEAADKMKERCIALMHKRLNFGYSNKRFIVQNREFLRLKKILMKNEIA